MQEGIAIDTAIEHESCSVLEERRFFVRVHRFTGPLIGLVLLSTALTLRASAPQNREAAYLSEVHAAMTTMHVGMVVQPTGDIDTDFPMTVQPSGGNSYGPRRHHLDTTLGKGGAHITVSTFSGNVELRRSGSRPHSE